MPGTELPALGVFLYQETPHESAVANVIEGAECGAEWNLVRITFRCDTLFP